MSEGAPTSATAPAGGRPRPTPPGAAREQLDWVTWARVLAILGVVSIHNAAPNAAAPDARDSVAGTVAIALDLGFVEVVPLFVMVSGALLLDPHRFRSSGQFLRHRAWRLIPPLVFWNVFYVVLDGLLTGRWRDPVELVRDAVTGRIAVHLYFFWIVLGLALLTPVVVRWVAVTGRREWLAGGLLAASIPVLTTTTTGLREEPMTFVHTAWTWWIPYAGAFVLGWALRGVVLRGGRLAAAALLGAGLTVLVAWQWRNPAAPEWLQTLAPVNYYGPTVLLLTVAAFLVAQGALRADGPLHALVSPGVMRLVAPVGAATLGVFGLHLAVLRLAIEWEWFGPGATTVPLLLARYVVVVAVTLAVVLPLRRVPWVRAVL